MKHYLTNECIEAVWYDGTNADEVRRTFPNLCYIEKGRLCLRSFKSFYPIPIEPSQWCYKHPKGRLVQYMSDSQFRNLYTPVP